MATDFKSLGKNEQGALIAGAVALVVSFFTGYIRASFSGGKGIPGIDVSYGLSAWHSYATLGILLVIVSAGIVAAKAFAADSLPDGVPWSLISLATAGLGLILLILRPLTIGGGGGGFSVGPGWSAYLLWIAVAALTYFTFMLFKASGDKMPDMPRKSTPPAA